MAVPPVVRSIAVVALAAVLACSRAEPAPPAADEDDVSSPLVLGIVVNHGVTPELIRGWPLVVRAVAALDADTEQAIALGDDTLSLRFVSLDGAAQDWALRKVGGDEPNRALDATTPRAEAVFVADAAQTTSYALGPYRAELAWGNATYALDVTVVDPPSLAGAEGFAARLAKTSLEIEALLADDRTADAVAIADMALAVDPGSIALLNWAGAALVAAKRPVEALAVTSTAIDLYRSQVPTPDEPPVIALHVQQQALDQILGVSP